MDRDILYEVDNPEFKPIPCPHIGIRPLDEQLEKIRTHLNGAEDVSADNLSLEDVRSLMSDPFAAGSQPILTSIHLAALPEDERTDDDVRCIEEMMPVVLNHETLHIVLYHVEGQEASVKLDNLSLHD